MTKLELAGAAPSRRGGRLDTAGDYDGEPTDKPDLAAMHSLSQGDNVIRLLSAKQFVIERLRALIQSGDLKPGEKLVVGAIASQLGVSRTPVRDAAWALAQEGLLEVVPRVGVFVRRILPQEALDIYEIKQALEPLAAAWATLRATQIERTAFAASCNLLQDAAEQGNVAEYTHLVELRRRELLRMAASPVLAQEFAIIDSRVRLLRFRNLSQPGTLRVSAAQHQRVADAIRIGDPELARTAMADHIADAKVRVSHILNQPGAGASGASATTERAPSTWRTEKPFRRGTGT